MGLFSSGGKGNSRANTSSESNTVNTTTTSIDNRIYQSDFGAIQAATDIGLEALRMGEANLRTAGDLAGRGLDNALEAQRGAYSFGERALAANERVSSDAFGAFADIAGDALHQVGQFGATAIGEVSGTGRAALQEVTDFGRSSIDAVTGAQKGVLDFAFDVFDQAVGAQATLTQQNIGGLTGLARQTSESADDRVSRVALYAFAALAVIFVVPKLFGSASA